ncbi:Binding-protein-dependent transport system inner membrane component [Amycolatopsis australiensis]|uniref:Binding-protein-dependent transport system inner membrane component n=2 Tax=Amycolatopsis australiensis TaxID=546364 RepID=A0A1K1S1W6_9PSEU|nr:Binding-protein-dependent transport system inner membrane component [Amycolatopsis australiensis]
MYYSSRPRRSGVPHDSSRAHHGSRRLGRAPPAVRGVGPRRRHGLRKRRERQRRARRVPAGAADGREDHRLGRCDAAARRPALPEAAPGSAAGHRHLRRRRQRLEVPADEGGPVQPDPQRLAGRGVQLAEKRDLLGGAGRVHRTAGQGPDPAFWTGAGGWIVVMYGALDNISPDLLEAARIDGAGGWQTAWRIQIPLLSQASVGVAGHDYSLNQLSYDFAFQNDNVNTAAAISVELLVAGLVVAGVFVTRSGFFDAD